MTDIEQLKQEEIEQLTKTESITSLESLITEGAELEIPITFDYPTQNGLIKASAIIKPVTAVEWENAQNYALKNHKEFMLKILEKGLLNDNGEPLPMKLLRKLPFGVANEIYKRIADVSGIKEDREEQFELTKELLGI